jgi:hypothetical protein
MKDNVNEKRVLALSVNSQGFGFVSFDGPRELLDWGMRSFRGGVNAVKVPIKDKVLRLFDAHQPDILLLKESKTQQSKKIVDRIAKLARAQAIPIAFVSKHDIHEAFAAEKQSKYHIGATIAVYYPELLPHLPPRRKPWQSEKYGIQIFEAAALGLAYFSDNPSTPES